MAKKFQSRRRMKFSEVEIVVYHHPCMDGTFSAAIVLSATNKEGKTSYDEEKEEKEKEKEKKKIFYPLTQGLPAPVELLGLVTGKNVLFLDITPKEDDLRKICVVAKDVLVLDHHESELATLQRVLSPEKFVYSTVMAGCGLTWKYCRDGGGDDESSDVGRYTHPIPRLLKVAQDHDLGKITEESKNLLFFVGTLINGRGLEEPSVKLLSSFSSESSDSASECLGHLGGISARKAITIIAEALLSSDQGEKLLAAANAMATMKRANEITTMKRVVTETLVSDSVPIPTPTPTTSGSSSSSSSSSYTIIYARCDDPTLLSDARAMLVAEHPEVDIYAFWRYDGKNDQTIFSLRSPKAEVNLSTFAKHYGGGGHPAAAGIQLKGNVEPKKLK